MLNAIYAGQRYAILLTDLSPPTFINVYSNFQTASQLGGYTSLLFVTASNAFTDDGAGFYLAGPGFSFTNLAAVAPGPALKITRPLGPNALLAWPAAPLGFVLQQKTVLTATNWTLATNAVTSLNGTNQVTFQGVTGNRYFRLLHP